MANLKLYTGELVLFDDEDASTVLKYKWHMLKSHVTDKSGYAAASVRDKETGETRSILMHRLILGCSCKVDHVDGNKLDNRKSNLRQATGTQNAGNSKDRKGSSRFKGVSWHKRDKSWQANLMTTVAGNQKLLHLGYFDDETEAARAYDSAAKRYFGEFARINFGAPVSS